MLECKKIRTKTIIKHNRNGDIYYRFQIQYPQRNIIFFPPRNEKMINVPLFYFTNDYLRPSVISRTRAPNLRPRFAIPMVDTSFWTGVGFCMISNPTFSCCYRLRVFTEIRGLSSRGCRENSRFPEDKRESGVWKVSRFDFLNESLRFRLKSGDRVVSRVYGKFCIMMKNSFESSSWREILY